MVSTFWLDWEQCRGTLERPCTAGILASVTVSELGVGISFLEDLGELVHLALLS